MHIYSIYICVTSRLPSLHIFFSSSFFGTSLCYSENFLDSIISLFIFFLFALVSHLFPFLLNSYSSFHIPLLLISYPSLSSSLLYLLCVLSASFPSSPVPHQCQHTSPRICPQPIKTLEFLLQKKMTLFDWLTSGESYKELHR